MYVGTWCVHVYKIYRFETHTDRSQYSMSKSITLYQEEGQIKLLIREYT